MELRYSEGRVDVGSLQEALAIVRDLAAPQHFCLVTQKPSGIKSSQYLTMTNSGECIDTYSGARADS